jgi:predicted nucleic acid-binding protein
MLNTVIFDNSVFGYFVEIKKVNLEIIVRNLIQEKVIIPSHIISEMEPLAIREPKIQKCINQAYKKQFYHFCDTFDLITLDFLRGKLDKGEASAIAQANKRQIPYFISDDIKNLTFLKENFSHIRQYSTYFLIALADVSGLLPNYEDVLAEFALLRCYDKFSAKTKKGFKIMLRNEYEAALQLKFGNNYNKKICYKKTSIDTILKQFYKINKRDN